MSKSIRIRTTPGDGEKYVKVELKQDFDLLEILSLNIKQADVYRNFCSSYGVVAGRVIINNGFGVPNVKVSVFVPIDEADSNNPIIKQIYPYESPNRDDKNVNGIRYNLLPSTQQNFDHTPVGTFPRKSEILDDQITLEIYDKYYKYTTVTNNAGDFMLLGVPTGNQILHYDMDVSDIGFLSARPYELISQGFKKELFLSPFKFKNDRNLDSLPQITSQDITINVQPFWCDDLSRGRVIGITREDISIDAFELVPTATFFGAMFSDDERDSINKNCRPRKKMGKMSEVITGEGKLEAIIREDDGSIEEYEIPDNAVDNNGNWSVQIPMNLRRVVTDEFGNLIPSPDGAKGVATECDIRFRVSMDATSNDKRLRQRASYLVPNMTGNYNFGEYTTGDLNNSTPFKLNTKLSTFTTGTPYSADTTNQYNYLEEFYTFRWKKVYSVRQYIGRYQSSRNEESRAFTGIKHILSGEGVNKFPTNRIDTQINPLYSILCVLLGIFGMLVAIINSVLNIFNGLITMLCQLKIPVKIKVYLRYCLNLPLGVELCNPTYRCWCCPSQVNTAGTDCDCGGGASGCGANCKKCGARFDLSITLEWKCIIAPLLCKKCSSLCPGRYHSCCRCPNTSNKDNGWNCGRCDRYTKSNCTSSNCNKAIPKDEKCCNDCCIKIPLIGLKCDGMEPNPMFVTIIPTPFGGGKCNGAQTVPCLTCAGVQWSRIKDWVACKLEGLAQFLNMLRFDFYNDWVGGSLYFPLFKRKYKVKTSKKKAGQIKKDKFCDFQCFDEYQTPLTYSRWKLRVKNNTVFKDETIEVSGCKVRFKASFKEITPLMGNLTTTDVQAKEMAAAAMVFNGVDSNDQGCRLSFTDSAVVSAINASSRLEYKYIEQKLPGPFGKPFYIKSEDPVTGIDTWVNIGGNSHHKNKCNSVFTIEKGEYFKDSLDCGPASGAPDPSGDDFAFTDPEDDGGDMEVGALDPSCDTDPTNDCDPQCSSLGVKACNVICSCFLESAQYNNDNILHGLIRWEKGNLYYASVILPGDAGGSFNISQYKSNMLFPTNILELGSSVYCDIDDVPFIMDQLVPSTFQVSEESNKFKGLNQTGSVINYDPGRIKEREGDVNLSAYVEFGCLGTNCINTMASVNQSQIGVEIIDKDDIDREWKAFCWMRFDHDEPIREYFCSKFNGYKDIAMTPIYIRPSANDLDNIYTPYPEHTITPGNIYHPVGEAHFTQTINGGDPFLTGDRCGIPYNNNSSKTQYFYGLAPQYTEKFMDFQPGNINEKSPPEEWGIKFNKTQTPYYLYFGIIPGRTALHRVVASYFADKINKITLAGISGDPDESEENTMNRNNFRNVKQNKFSVLKSCLGSTQLIGGSGQSTAGGGSGVHDGTGSGDSGDSGSEEADNYVDFGASAPPAGNSSSDGVTIDGGTSSSITCTDNPSYKSTTIIITDPPSTVIIEVFGGTAGNSTSASGTFNLHLLGPGGSPPSTTNPSDAQIYDCAATLPPGYSPGGHGTSMSAKLSYGGSNTQWYEIEFTTGGTYRVDYSYTCIGGNTDGYVALRI